MDSEVVTKLKSILNECLDAINKSSIAFVSTMDGHLLLSRDRGDGSIDIDNLCPISGSLMGISEAVGKQMHDGVLSDTFIRTEKDVIAIFKVHDAYEELLLGIIADKTVMLGSMVSMGKAHADKVKMLIDSMD